jgi:hypothetical protein
MGRARTERPRTCGIRRARLALLGLAFLSLGAAPAASAARFTVCSITINSDDEIRTFRKRLPASRFDFVELADAAHPASVAGEPDWFSRACASGVRCDVLVVSGHFANVYAGSEGTTFVGTSGLSISLEALERRRCDESCPGILSSLLEVHLFGCRTLATSLDAERISPADLARLARHHVPPRVAERIVEEISYHGADTSNRARMRFVFAGAPRIYGFADVAPLGENVASRLDGYLASGGDPAERLRRLRAARDEARVLAPNRELERALRASTFTQTSGLPLGGPAHELESRACLLGSERSSVSERLHHMERLLEEPGFLAYLRSIGSFLRSHDPLSFDAAEHAVLERIRQHPRVRAVVNELVRELESPILRHEILRVSRQVGWISADDALPLQRAIVVRLLEPPVYGGARDLICGIDRDVAAHLALGPEDVSAEVYRDEFGIQALGCLRPADERIRARLARSLVDPREWIARLTATALDEMSSLTPPHVE